jgi:hypothetical protein
MKWLWQKPAIEKAPFCEQVQHGRCDTWIVFRRYFIARCGVCRTWYLGTCTISSNSNPMSQFYRDLLKKDIWKDKP